MYRCLNSPVDHHTATVEFPLTRAYTNPTELGLQTAPRQDIFDLFHHMLGQPGITDHNGLVGDLHFLLLFTQEQLGESRMVVTLVTIIQDDQFTRGERVPRPVSTMRADELPTTSFLAIQWVSLGQVGWYARHGHSSNQSASGAS